MRALIVIATIFFGSLFSGALGNNVGFDLDEIDTKLIQAFSKRCDSSSFMPLAFPALTYSKSDLISCEIAKAFYPEKYQTIHAKLLAAYAFKNSIFAITSWSATSALDELFKIKPEDSDVDRLLKGDFRAINLFNKKQPDGNNFTGLSDDQLEKAGAIFGKQNALLLYASDAQLFAKINDWTTLDEATSHLLSEAKNLDPTNLNRATQRLSDSIFSLVLKMDPEASFMSGALLIPTNTRKKLLSLNALSPYLPQKLVDDIKRVEYSFHDLTSHFRMGSERNLLSFSFDLVDINIFWALNNLKIADGAVYTMPVANSLLYLDHWRVAAPDNYANMVALFYPEIETLADTANYNTLTKMLSKLDTLSPQEVSAPYDWLIKHQLRYLILNPDWRQEGDNAIMDGLPNLWFEHALKSENKITKIIMNQKLVKIGYDFQDKFFQTVKSVKSVKDLCGSIDMDTCSKLVREIDIDLIFERELKLLSLAPPDGSQSSLKWALDGVKKDGITSFWSCKVSDLGRTWAKIGFSANYLPSKMVDWCPFHEISDVLEVVGLKHEDLILKAAAFPATTGLKFLGNQSVWTDQSLALLPIHLNNGPEQFHHTQLPTTGISQAGIAHPSYDTLVANLTGERGVNQTPEPNQLYLNLQPFGALAEIYAYEGAFELAYFAQMKSYNKAKGNTYQDANVRLGELAKLKYYSRIAGVPPKLLADYIQTEFHEQTDLALLANDDPDEWIKSVSNGNLPDYIVEQRKFGLQYLGVMEDIDLSSLNTVDDFKMHIGSIMSLSDVKTEELCKTDALFQLTNNTDVLDFNNPVSELDMKLLYNLGSDKIYINEFNRLASICATSHPVGNTYKTIMETMVLPALKNEGSPVHNQNLLYVYSMIAQISAKEARPFGLFMALIASKYIFVDQMKSYNTFGSQGLREYQTILEKIIGAAGSVSNDVMNTLSENFQSLFATNINVLAAGFHTPVLSQNTTKRLMKSDSFFIIGEKSKSDWLSFQKSNLEALAASKNIDEYVAARAQFSDFDYSVGFDNMHIAHEANEFLNNISSETGSRARNTNLFNILYGSGNYFVQGFSREQGLNTFGGKLSHSSIEAAKKRFASGDISDELITNTCEVFRPIRDQVKAIWQPKDAMLVPSVNLFPIPPRLIFGSFCEVDGNDQSKEVILMGDLAVGLEYMRDGSNVPKAYHFLGLGNPQSIKNKGIKINIGNIVASRGVDKVSLNDLNRLPPLPLAAKEVSEAKNYFENFDLFLNTEASVSKLLTRAEEVSVSGSNPLITVATHGFTSSLGDGKNLPSLLSSDDGELSLVHSNQVSSYNLEGSIVMLSACDTAAGFADRSDLTFTGFVQAFGDAGASLVQASLWPIYSDAAKQNTEEFLSQINKSGPIDASFAAQRRQKDINSLPVVYIFP